jgi:hypothetical protein
MLNVEKAAGSHVISLGSGPDVFRPVHDFPLAQHFHLFDCLAGWGDSPTQVVEEIESRLASIAGGTPPVRLTDGFWASLSPDLRLDGDMLWSNAVISYPVEPMVWKACWNSPSLGLQEKYVYLHMLDYDNPQQLVQHLNAMGNGADLGGLLLASAPWPRPECMDALLKLLRPGSEFVYENYSNTAGEPVDSQYADAFAEIQKSCRVTEAPLDAEFNTGLSRWKREVRTYVARKGL